MGRHSRKAPAPVRPLPEPEAPLPPYEPQGYAADPYGDGLYAPGPYEPAPARHPRPPQGGTRPSAEPTVVHEGYASPRGPRPVGHPEHREGGGTRGSAPAPAGVYGDWRGTPRAATAAPPAAAPATGPAPAAEPAPRDPFTSTGSHRRVPGPRRPEAEPAAPASGRGAKIRTYTGMAAAAVTTVLAVVVAGQVAADGDSDTAARAAGDDAPQRTQTDSSPASRSDGRATPSVPPAAAAEPATYEQRMAQQLPIDAKLTGPGAFDTVPGVAKAPGRGKKVRYRVDVEQGLGMDAQLFADAVQRTLNDPRSWAHGDAMTFERVPGGEAEFVITLASPGTTGVWCAKSGLDTTIDNVSCDSASTERVMINAFRWGQGSQTYGADQMLAYRQMLINHEVGHRLGHGHVSCQTPGALAPIMQQQTKSLDIDNIHCKPNPWVFPGS
ncbi:MULTISPECIES: DUF3152 domain-containing protein [Streptomyces]|uniref:DUF3152 domain-containing protein n=1 Tax=Streptomyces TaxID=1883 RepID=UPI000F712B52|nr:DUF3152 domain-containing protein [Streptomyces sp. W1SF4]AZM91038.1 DUF3152 domain-containing protein [Streptomyces sp. W1SF4]